jgi:restriction endonuclease Mrr
MAETLCRLVAKDSKALDLIEWRELERIIAAALDAIGFTVVLTPGSKDGGKDVVANCIVSNTEQTYYIEIKHWRKGNRPGPNHVSDFVELNARDRTDGGLFLSSSGFTNGVYAQVGEISRQRVHLGEREKIVSLCQHFVRRKDGMWYPAQPLPELLFADTLN